MLFPGCFLIIVGSHTTQKRCAKHNENKNIDQNTYCVNDQTCPAEVSSVDIAGLTKCPNTIQDESHARNCQRQDRERPLSYRKRRCVHPIPVLIVLGTLASAYIVLIIILHILLWNLSIGLIVLPLCIDLVIKLIVH